jgi:hypothetical protein
MKRTVLMTIWAMSPTLGSNSAYANGSCLLQVFVCRLFTLAANPDLPARALLDVTPLFAGLACGGTFLAEDIL